MKDHTYLAALRATLGLTQAEMSLVLGLRGKSLARLEGGSTLTPSLHRLVRLVANMRLGELESALRVALEEDFTAPLRERLRGTVQELIGQGASVNDTVAMRMERRERPTDWVFWATSARAAANETKALADEAGFICRPLRFAHAGKGFSDWSRPDQPTDYDYLLDLKPGDCILLCHSGEPLGWYRIQKAKPGAPAREMGRLPNPIMRFVQEGSALGSRLSKGNYRLWDGSMGAGDQGWYSGLAVKKVKRALATPAPRRAGIRDTMTPFVALEK